MLKALVIDDEPSTLFMFNLFLEAYGYEVITAENGAAGIEMFKKQALRCLKKSGHPSCLQT
jgi:CheY-like chemotaxis protein